MAAQNLSVVARLARGCEPELNTGCLLWAGTPNNKGYGTIAVAGRTQRVHRVSYATHKGEIPQGLNVLHKCDTPACCNPEHIFLGTASENMQDMLRKGRGNKPAGQHHGRSRLKDDDVRDIAKRLEAGEKVVDIARAHGVHATTVTVIKRGRNWTHITGYAREALSRQAQTGNGEGSSSPKSEDTQPGELNSSSSKGAV